MAKLTRARKKRVARTFIKRVFVDGRRTAALGSDDIERLIDDINGALDACAATIEAAIDPTIRAKAPADLKAAAIAMVALERAGIDRA